MPPTSEFHAAVERALAGVSPRVVTLDETGSTNDDARALAREGAPHLTVVVAQHQTAGRGRLGRVWASPPGLGLHASWIVRPDLEPERWTLIPLLAGVAAAEAVRARTKVEVTLKWPNDLRARDRKLGGLLVEAEVPHFLVVGLGINVSHTEFPADLRDIATSVALCGGLRLDRADLLAAVLTRFVDVLAEPATGLSRYRALCETLGKQVRIERAGAEPSVGRARDIDRSGALLVQTPDGEEIVPSGDVVHLRDARFGAR